MGQQGLATVHAGDIEDVSGGDGGAIPDLFDDDLSEGFQADCPVTIGLQREARDRLQRWSEEVDLALIEFELQVMTGILASVGIGFGSRVSPRRKLLEGHAWYEQIHVIAEAVPYAQGDRCSATKGPFGVFATIDVVKHAESDAEQAFPMSGVVPLLERPTSPRTHRGTFGLDGSPAGSAVRCWRAW